MEWIPAISISTVANGLYATCSKISEFYYKPDIIVFYINVVALIIIISYQSLFKKVRLNLKEINIYVVLTGILFALNNIFLLKALNSNLRKAINRKS